MGLGSTPLYRVCYVLEAHIELACRRLEQHCGAMRVDSGGLVHVVVPHAPAVQLYGVRALRWPRGRIGSTVQVALDIARGPVRESERVIGPTLSAVRRALARVR
jgi:hypothetical protein